MVGGSGLQRLSGDTLRLGPGQPFRQVCADRLQPARILQHAKPSLSPAQANTGETVTISATVANAGDVDGTYTVVLKINDKVESTQSITVAATPRKRSHLP